MTEIRTDFSKKMQKKVEFFKKHLCEKIYINSYIG